MGAIGLVKRGTKVARPFMEAVQTAQDLSQGGGEIVVLPTSPAATERLKEILGTPAPTPSEDALAVAALTPGDDVEAVLAPLANRRRSDGGALAILTGDGPARAELEARVLGGHRLEPSNIAHVAVLDDDGAERVVDAVLRVLGDELIAAGRRNAGLRPAIGSKLVERAARRAATIGALPLPGIDLPVLALLQVRLVADLAALHDRPIGAERAVEALAVAGAGFGWRAVGRSATALIPVAGWAVRGAVAYGATRAVGELALARLSAGHDVIEGLPIDAVRPHIDRAVGIISR